MYALCAGIALRVLQAPSVDIKVKFFNLLICMDKEILQRRQT
jgi:hypothetical protein